MTSRIMRAVYLGSLVILLFQSVSSQTSNISTSATDKYLISAKAGGVNYVEGSATVLRKNGKSGYLTQRDQIEVGDVVSTAADSRIEILLNPGSFLRLGPNSSFEFNTTGLEDLRVKLDSGSAIFEVFASRDFKVRVTTANAKLLLIKSGVFRIDVTSDGGAKIEVSDGEALLGDRNATLLRKGFAAKLNRHDSTVEKYNRKALDALEAWSKTRSKELAKQSAKLRDQALRDSLLTAFNGGQWGMYNSFGLWVFNPAYGGFCFLPFGNGWSSPYGFGYGNCICSWHLPYDIYHYPHHGSGGGSAGGGGTTVNASTPIASAGDRTPVPPFVRMEQAGGRGLTDWTPFPVDRSPRAPDGPVYSPPPVVFTPPPPPASDPATGSRPR
jgi:FecR protein